MFPNALTINKARKALLATLWVAIICLTACQKYEPDSFTVTVEALPQPNQYRTRLKWNVSDYDGDHWILQRQTDREPLATLATVPNDSHEYVDATVLAGTTYRYVLASDDTSAMTLKKTLDITIPRDLAVSGVSSLPSVSGIGRFVIPKGSRILTNGKDIEISVDQIISDGGSIETFPEGQTAAANTAGRSGGTLKIHARTGRGILTVIARGETGGPSTTAGAPGAPGANGTPGPNANCGYKGNDAACGMSPNDYQGIVQKCKDGGIFGLAFCQILGNFYCKSQPGNGGQGGQGYPGGQGGPGFNGGDSGNILIDILELSTLDVKPISIAGAGGIGGPGGAGGAGGQGGPPGSQDNLHICTGNASWGSQGPAGSVGKPGPSGAAGNKGAVCLKLGASSSGDCSKF